MNGEGMGHVDATYDWSTGNDNIQRASDILFGVSIHSDPTKSQIIDLSYSAMHELSIIGNLGEPLWQPQNHHRHQTLNKKEYLRQFGQMDDTLRDIIKLVEVGQPQSLSNLDSYLCENSISKVNKNEGLQVEGSRDMEYIKMSASDIVELLMDMNQWSREFFNIVSSTTMVGTLLDGAQGSTDGKLHVMSAELHLPTPFAPSRECYFARYCKQLSQHIWGVVDISLEKFFPSPSNNFRKRPSGCLIEAMPNGFSKVIWVEHVEANHDQVNKQFRPLVTSGFAFGATRWLSSIVQHSEWLETLKGPTLVADNGVLISKAGRISLLNVADRMMRTFVSDINTSTRNSWIQIPIIPGSADVKFIVKNNSDEIGKPIGTSVVFTTSLWVNASPNQLFNFLRHGSSRKKWDLLSHHLSVREFAYMNNGKNLKNRVSLMRAFTSEDKTEIFYIQKSYTDSMASYVVYAPLDESSLKGLGNGSNPNIVMILPSGFVICPSGFPRNDVDDKNNSGGSILTIAFHIVESSSIRSFIPSESVETLYKVITDTVSAISDAVVYNNMYKTWLM
ncbi:PREDICTED: homeobox-leucine zipper protein MERISTEM L1-like [Lupinus angustifolius]|uniref:homeobox-leucine zipper protein MERISTEM L1-like n=1 Tax=Lupinus angustifolius TaxID=3871 RepID=UPI00092E8217|nr:PREDICTED: homeobox-leucine zipper protein MERISTEM L1-like [Lupinus angustifolius]